jgi:hypothetical protein
VTPLDRAANALRELWLIQHNIPIVIDWDQLKRSEQEQWIARAKAAVTNRQAA